jgi:ribosomal-protein-alanine N-acetyltransferase
MNIRPIKPSDLENLATIHAASFGSAAWSTAHIQSSLTLNTTKGWVAGKDSQLIGFVLLQCIGYEAEILTFCVHPAVQRTGTGQRLLNAAMNSGVTRIFLEVAADNIAACSLYEKLGFQKFGIRKGYYKRANTAVDAILYQVAITPHIS